MKQQNFYGLAQTHTDLDDLDLTPLVEAARYVCWHYSLIIHCYAPGDMLKSYMDAYARAQHENKAALRRAFPLIAGFMDSVAQEDTEQVEIIKHLARYGMAQHTEGTDQ